MHEIEYKQSDNEWRASQVIFQGDNRIGSSIFWVKIGEKDKKAQRRFEKTEAKSKKIGLKGRVMDYMDLESIILHYLFLTVLINIVLGCTLSPSK